MRVRHNQQKDIRIHTLALAATPSSMSRTMVSAPRVTDLATIFSELPGMYRRERRGLKTDSASVVIVRIEDDNRGFLRTKALNMAHWGRSGDIVNDMSEFGIHHINKHMSKMTYVSSWEEFDCHHQWLNLPPKTHVFFLTLQRNIVRFVQAILEIAKK